MLFVGKLYLIISDFLYKIDGFHSIFLSIPRHRSNSVHRNDDRGVTIVPQLLGSLRLNFTSLVNDDFGLSRTTNIYNNNIQFIYKCTEIK